MYRFFSTYRGVGGSSVCAGAASAVCGAPSAWGVSARVCSCAVARNVGCWAAVVGLGCGRGCTYQSLAGGSWGGAVVESESIEV